MKVVLLQHIPNVGQKGEVKIVRDGFAANFLLPQKLAQAVGDSFVAPIVSESVIAPVSTVAIKGLNGATISLAAKVTGAKNLYAGINAAEIIQQVKLQLGIDLQEKQLIDFKALKHSGHFQLPIKNGQERAILTVIVKAEAHGH
ncbi:MAG: 50S ribosomal L9 C-terminal domain-containing protein [Candidatus Komeilibacteria bacterium]